MGLQASLSLRARCKGITREGLEFVRVDPSKGFFRRFLTREKVVIPYSRLDEPSRVWRSNLGSELLVDDKELDKELVGLFCECGIDAKFSQALFSGSFQERKETAKGVLEAFGEFVSFKEEETRRKGLSEMLRELKEEVFTWEFDERACIKRGGLVEEVVSYFKQFYELNDDLITRTVTNSIDDSESRTERLLARIAADIPSLKKDLKSSDQDKVAYAAVAIGVTRATGCTQELIGALERFSKGNAFNAIVFSLGMLGTREATDCLLGKLKTPRLNSRSAVLKALSLVDDERVATLLLSEMDELVRRLPKHFLEWLKKIGGGESEKSRLQTAAAKLFEKDSKTSVWLYALYCYANAYASSLARNGELRAFPYIVYLFKKGILASGVLVRFARKRPEKVFERIRRVYLQAREQDTELRDACIRVLTAIHLENLKKKQETSTNLGVHSKEWGFEDFEINEAQRMGLTTMCFKPRRKASELRVRLNEESDLSHHFVGEGDAREFCFSTSFHLHAQKHVGVKVMAGKVKIVYGHDKKEKIMTTGEVAFQLPPGTPHQIMNVGDTDALVIEFESPAFKDDIIRLENPYKTDKKASGY